MKKAVLITATTLMCLLCLLCAADTQRAKVDFYEGNSYYRKGQYQEAILSYTGIIKSGFESGPLYYNLANAYIKADEVGKGIVNYLRAQRFMPRDADLAANLKYAYSLSMAGQDAPARGFSGIVDFLAGMFTLGELFFFVLLCYYFLIGCAVGAVVRKEKRRLLLYPILALCAVCIAGTIVFTHKLHGADDTSAIVTASRVPVKFEPADEATTYFTLFEGARVQVVSSDETWAKIARHDGKQGWIKASAVEKL